MLSQMPNKRYFKIGEVSKLTGVEAHTIRYWESEFKQLKPRRAGSRQRLYRRQDVQLIDTIRNLLHDEKYTIAGAKRRLSKGPAKKSATRAKAKTGAAAEAAPTVTRSLPRAEAAEPEIKPDPPHVPAEPAAEVKTADDQPLLFPGLNSNGINSAGAQSMKRIQRELEGILKILS